MAPTVFREGQLREALELTETHLTEITHAWNRHFGT